MDVHCSTCGERLKEPGALMFSPPTALGSCHKSHLCEDCYDALRSLLEAIHHLNKKRGGCDWLKDL